VIKSILQNIELILMDFRRATYLLDGRPFAMLRHHLKKTGKFLIFFIAFYAGATRLLILLISTLHREKNSIVLIYHHIFKDTGDIIFPGVTEQVFKKQVEYLTQRFDLVPFEKIIGGLQNGMKFSRIPVALTFDDGFQDNFSLALPILKRNCAPATFFVTTDHISTGNMIWTEEMRTLFSGEITPKSISMPFSHSVEFPLRDRKEKYRALFSLLCALKNMEEGQKESALDKIKELLDQPPDLRHDSQSTMMSWEMVKECLESGVTIGSHGQTHAIATGIAPNRFQQEVKCSKGEIEVQTGTTCLYYAYPNGTRGDFNDRTKKILMDAEYEAAVTTIDGVVKKTDDPFELKRKVPRNLPLFITVNDILLAYVRELFNGIGSKRTAGHRPGVR